MNSFFGWATALSNKPFFPDDNAFALANAENDDTDLAIARSTRATAFDYARLSWAA